MGSVSEGMLLWEPSAQFQAESTMAAYMRWLAEQRQLTFSDYASLWQWSVDNLEDFWAGIWDYFRIQAATPYAQILTNHAMPDAHWFAGAQLNYAEHVFRCMTADYPALIFQSERTALMEISWQQLHHDVAALAAALKDMGIVDGDRVVAYLPNIPQTLVAFLACASIGAVWSSCSPDFGIRSVTDRFAQIEPRVLFAVDGYSYNGKVHDRLETVSQIRAALPTLACTVLVSYAFPEQNHAVQDGMVRWDDLLARRRGTALAFTPVPFDHPLWILYSSGTTGLPKAIVHGHGGILLEHFRVLGLHSNVKRGDRIFWYTTTGWMMWNFIISGLLLGATVALYDGSAGYPSLDALWAFAAQARLSLFGTSAGFLTTCMSQGLEPKRSHDLGALTSVQSTGSPLSPEGFQWVYERVKDDVWLASVSGGTDVCTGFVGGAPILPVRAGEIQCRGLGIAVAAFDEAGQPVMDQVGELVVTRPMPSMPLLFWNDPDGTRYYNSYFAMYPGVWRHGDWIKITARGSCIIYGRSDSTINRMGVRMGTSEIYRVVEDIPEVVDSLVVDLEALGRSSYMALFVVLKDNMTLDATLANRIKHRIRNDISPRHVPDEIIAIAEVPRTLSGKKLEVPIRKILLGTPVERAVSTDSLSNPSSLTYFLELARRLNPS